MTAHSHDTMPHADGAVAAGLAGCALIVIMITTQTCFAALFPSHNDFFKAKYMQKVVQKHV